MIHWGPHWWGRLRIEWFDIWWTYSHQIILKKDTVNAECCIIKTWLSDLCKKWVQTTLKIKFNVNLILKGQWVQNYMYCGATYFRIKDRQFREPPRPRDHLYLAIWPISSGYISLCTEMAITPLIMVRFLKFKKFLKAGEELCTVLAFFSTHDHVQAGKFAIFGSHDLKSHEPDNKTLGS